MSHLTEALKQEIKQYLEKDKELSQTKINEYLQGKKQPSFWNATSIKRAVSLYHLLEISELEELSDLSIVEKVSNILYNEYSTKLQPRLINKIVEELEISLTEIKTGITMDAVDTITNPYSKDWDKIRDHISSNNNKGIELKNLIN